MSVDPDAMSLWAAVDDYFAVLAPEDEHLVATREAAAAAGLPDIAVAANQGKLLRLVAELAGSRRILEIGTLGGYSTLWLARALPPDGKLVSLEIDQKHAMIARTSMAYAGVDHLVEIVVGPAADSLDRMAADQVTPFDLVFIDADKESLAQYLEQSLALSHPGTVIIVDNVVRRGAVIDEAHPDERVQGVRRMVDLLAEHPRLDPTVIQTVGVKGHDGFALLRVLP